MGTRLVARGSGLGSRRMSAGERWLFTVRFFPEEGECRNVTADNDLRYSSRFRLFTFIHGVNETEFQVLSLRFLSLEPALSARQPLLFGEFNQVEKERGAVWRVAKMAGILNMCTYANWPAKNFGVNRRIMDEVFVPADAADSL